MKNREKKKLHKYININCTRNSRNQPKEQKGKWKQKTQKNTHTSVQRKGNRWNISYKKE